MAARPRTKGVGLGGRGEKGIGDASRKRLLTMTASKDGALRTMGGVALHFRARGRTGQNQSSIRKRDNDGLRREQRQKRGQQHRTKGKEEGRSLKKGDRKKKTFKLRAKEGKNSGTTQWTGKRVEGLLH